VPFIGKNFTIGELMATRISKEVRDETYVGTGAASPVPMSGVLLAQATLAPDMIYVAIGSDDPALSPISGKETFDIAQRGKLDLFFLGGAQMDGHGNINLTTIGADHDHPDVRLPGAAGSGMLYYMTQRIILFRMEHTPRVFVEDVDFITTPGTSDERVHRPGGPTMLVTNLCVMQFNKQDKGFELESTHPGVSVEEVVKNTGFTFKIPDSVPETAAPTEQDLKILRSSVKEKISAAYPAFVENGGFGTS
jgi:glutaconate CoA-transferase subunit B